ncbi:YaaC-like Protein [Marine Group I thaumarchaeote SCGC AAA799-P11]|uniref:YaaC-like Protein n=1 Tax=Marine Group I thaumarchaeote SCGC AAA799-P11 TaxID=1502295 RepID=A0A087S374_9ARCH|nr:YaaC-like Protein [Marine Group I thaumarchaeote SCGC AAA799-P11]
MINDRVFFAESLLIPSSYRAIFKTIHRNLSSPNYPVICNTYKQKIEQKFHIDVPQIKDYSEYATSDFLRNVIFLKQAHNFGKLALNAIPEVKPLLLYYAENQLQAFFVYSIFHFKDNSFGHGLSISGNSYENIGVKIKEKGFFQRIVNAYTILGSSWIFSPLELTGGNGLQERDDPYSFVTTPTLRLKELIEIKNHAKPHPNGYILDQTDYLFLFLASFLARYKPDIWHEIVGGEKGDEFAYFKQSFTRFSLVWDRLIHMLFSIYHNTTPPPLSTPDYEMKQYQYQIN